MKELLNLSERMKSGRINRTQHLAYIVLLTYAALIFGTIAVLLSNKTMTWVAYGGLFLGGLACAVCFCLLKIKRLHDFDFSGWWMLVLWVPLLGALWGLMIFSITGTPGNNRYGPPAPEATLTEKILAFHWLAILGVAGIYGIWLLIWAPRFTIG